MKPKSLAVPKRCQQYVYHRYIVGRRAQCKRPALVGTYCWQHQEGGP
jgi:hypothetical protein